MTKDERIILILLKITFDTFHDIHFMYIYFDIAF